MLMLLKNNPTTTATWSVLEEHFKQIKDLHLKDLFEADPKRFENFSIQEEDI